jgi:hypothetical protein
MSDFIQVVAWTHMRRTATQYAEINSGSVSNPTRNQLPFFTKDD